MAESFIQQSYLPDLSVCDELIRYHENSPTRTEGKILSEKGLVVDKTRKDSEESALLFDSQIGQRYMKQLHVAVTRYIDKYPECSIHSPFAIKAVPKIQKYQPGGGFFNWHTERGHAKSSDVASRHLVFMTYLNDVTDAGETEFALQKLKVQPRKGLTLIWPVDWTHTHRGVASPTQQKYIVTGWLNFV